MQYVIVIGTENIGLFGTLSDYNTKYKCDFMRMGEDEECLKIIMVCVTWFPYKITLNNFSSQVLLNASFRFVSLIVCMRVSFSLCLVLALSPALVLVLVLSQFHRSMSSSFCIQIRCVLFVCQSNASWQRRIMQKHISIVNQGK